MEMHKFISCSKLMTDRLKMDDPIKEIVGAWFVAEGQLLLRLVVHLLKIE